ncbi:MAG TPA: TetR/AcrR family transcriptional regulator [Clostridia bacterium]|nr:TetR/AcrR family transcriptional regulator [Clostridia bacterium]
MPVRVFSVREREELRVKMLDAGIKLIKTHGMTHASVEKITQTAGLGKSTFYNFFPSKELFVLEIMAYQRDCAKTRFNDVLGDREKMTAAEGKAFFKKLVISSDSIYQYLTPDDERKLRAALPDHPSAKPEADAHTMISLLSHMEGVKTDVNMKLVANFFKMMALAMFHRDQMHQDELNDTFNRVFELIFDCVFE